MDRSPDRIEQHKSETASLLSDVALETIGELLAVVSNIMTAATALRRGDLKTLCQNISLFVIAIIFAIRSAVRWRARAARNEAANAILGQRNLYHPPQTWAAP